LFVDRSGPKTGIGAGGGKHQTALTKETLMTTTNITTEARNYGSAA
jgi:hypothetical protein